MGYAAPLQMDLIRQYYKDNPSGVAGLLPPDLNSATRALHPNMKSAAPGVITAVDDDATNATYFRVDASMYHGMFGGPVFEGNKGVSALSMYIHTQTILLSHILLVIGASYNNTNVNANTIIDVTSKGVRTVLGKYMS
jgi:hypothetical protein